MTKFVRKLYERDYESELAQDEEEDKQVHRMIPLSWWEGYPCVRSEKLPMFFNRSLYVLAGSRLSRVESLEVVRAMIKFVRRLYERDYESEIAQDEEEVKRVHHMIPSCLSDTKETCIVKPPSGLRTLLGLPCVLQGVDPEGVTKVTIFKNCILGVKKSSQHPEVFLH
jgi:hypothetical protein